MPVLIVRTMDKRIDIKYYKVYIKLMDKKLTSKNLVENQLHDTTSEEPIVNREEQASKINKLGTRPV